MSRVEFAMTTASRAVVGGFGGIDDLLAAAKESVSEQCDVAEIRLDLIADDTLPDEPPPWGHLRGLPLLFTARRGDEGGHGGLDAATRMRLLESALGDAACVDVEVASIEESRKLLEIVRGKELPWVASFHDFARLPERTVLESKAGSARDAGAAVFKVAALLHSPDDLARLAEFQLADHGIPVATMGMGPLAPVSRLLCAQCGSVLNYGYLGGKPTAPGQWSAGLLRQAIGRLTPFPE
jgi:3-dehydroquinate dehydratase-1